MNKKGILLKYWGYDQFRPNQEKIIDTVLSKKDCYKNIVKKNC